MTGGGGFLDLCYIVRHVLTEMGRADALITGHFFLPDVNLSVPSVGLDRLCSAYLKRNGYASLKELDYLMNLKENHDRFVQNYGSFEINTNRMPVDCCNLISCTNYDGTYTDNGYNYALSIAVDYVISLLTKNDSSTDNPTPVQMPVQKKRRHGAVYKYNFIGVTHAEIPLTDITTYLGTKSFLQFHHLFDPTPSEKDLKDFISASNMTFEQLLKQLTEGITYTVPYPELIKRANDIIPGDKRVINCADSWAAGTLGILEENRKTMAESLKNYNSPVQASSVIARIFSTLYTIALDPSRGPIFAAKLLGGPNNKNLMHVIHGYIQRNEEHLRAELCRESSHKQELTIAEQGLSKANFITRRRRIADYLDTINHWYVHLAILDRHNAMKSLLTELENQVTRLYNEFFCPLTTVLETLNNTFLENDRILSHKASNPSKALSRQVPGLSDVQSYLDGIINGLNPAREAQNLVQNLMNNWQSWIQQDENKITWMISQYMIQNFAPIIRKDMEHWIKFASKTPSDVIKELIEQATEPMLGDPSAFPLKSADKSCQLIVPAPCLDPGISAAQASKEPYEVISKRGNNRITVIKMYRGLPLYAWQGLSELEIRYECDIRAGIHLYENGDVDWREYLPSPLPASFHIHGHQIPRIAERNAKLAKELEEAKRAGIVLCDWENRVWHIKQSKTADLRSLSEEVHHFLTDGKWDMKKLCDLLDHIREVREQMYADGNVEEITLTAQDAENGQEESVLSDDYLRSPALQKIVREELEKLHGLDKDIADLEHR